LRLERHFVVRFSMNAYPGTPPEDEEFSTLVETETTVLRDEADPSRYQVALTIRFGDDEDTPSAYSGELVMVGFFYLDEGYPEKKHESLLHVTGSSLLYSAAREFLAMVTGRGIWEPIYLDTVSFIP